MDIGRLNVTRVEKMTPKVLTAVLGDQAPRTNLTRQSIAVIHSSLKLRSCFEVSPSSIRFRRLRLLVEKFRQLFGDVGSSARIL